MLSLLLEKTQVQQKFEFDEEAKQKIAQQVANAELMAQKKGQLQLNLVQNKPKLASAQIAVVKQAVEETPERAVSEVWEEAKVAKPASTPAPAAQALKPAAASPATPAKTKQPSSVPAVQPPTPTPTSAAAESTAAEEPKSDESQPQPEQEAAEQEKESALTTQKENLEVELKQHFEQQKLEFDEVAYPASGFAHLCSSSLLWWERHVGTIDIEVHKSCFLEESFN